MRQRSLVCLLGESETRYQATAPEEDRCAEQRLSICSLTAMATFVTVFLSLTSFLVVLRKPREGKGLVCRAFGDNWRRREMAPNDSLVEGDMTV